MRILILCLLITSLYSCGEESADKPSDNDSANNAELQVKDSTVTESIITDTVLTVSGANKHADDYIGMQISLSQGKVKILKDDEEVHAGLYNWVHDSLHIELEEYPYQLDYAVERGGEIDYQLSDNHGLILQLTLESHKLSKK